MSAGEDSVVYTPLIQGILKKRKDKMRLRWVTYWFKLHPASLLFYNIKHGSTSDLRGQYYLIEIEWVRELTWTKKKHYIFEITMKNGKRKVLAAETADLRQQWMCQLLQAMNHRVCNATEPTSNGQMAPDHMCRTHLSPCSVISNSQASDALVRKHHTAEHNSYLCSSIMHLAPATPATTSHIYIDLDMPSVESGQCAEDGVKQEAEMVEPENDYDFLPFRKPLHSEEVIYDTPPSNRRASEQEHVSSESIYDVPKFAFRQKSVNEASCSKEPPEMMGLLHDMVTCLGGNSADWARATDLSPLTAL